MLHYFRLVGLFTCLFLSPISYADWYTDIETGCKLWSKKERTGVRWNGKCVDGVAEGYGTRYWSYVSNGKLATSKFVGEMIWGRPDGQGKSEFESGETYSGGYSNGKYFGQGTYRWPDGIYYTGEWDGDRHGFGRQYWPDGGRYEGEWEDGQRHGQGTRWYSDGDRYEGQWKEGKRSGYGTYYWANGRKFEGNYMNGSREGEGAYYDSDGSLLYQGNYSNGERHGFGEAWYEDGIYEGNWVDGQRSGEGSYMFLETGEVWRGTWDGRRFISGGIYDSSGKLLRADDEYREKLKREQEFKDRIDRLMTF